MSHQNLTVISVAYIKITIIVAIFLNLSFNQCIYNVLRNCSNLASKNCFFFIIGTKRYLKSMKYISTSALSIHNEYKYKATKPSS